MKRLLKIILIFLQVLLVLIIGCGSENDDDDSGPTIDDDDDDDDDEEPVDDNDRENPAEFLIVTTDEMESAWKKFADWKDRTGIRAEVVLIEDIIGEKSKDHASLKSYLKIAAKQGVLYVLLAGDADQIPYARGYSEAWALEKYYGTAPIQTYYEDLTHDWDKDNDGQWGEKLEDITVEDMRSPVIAVARVPVETSEEAQGFIDKVIRYESADWADPQRAICPLFLGDVAASVPILGDIDGGMSHEQLINDYIPDHFIKGMRRLYSTELYANAVGAEIGSTQNVLEAFEDEGYAFSVTNTHGSFTALTLLLDTETVIAMTNQVPFIFISTSCLSGNFADKGYGNGDNPPQTGADSVAEELIKNPEGGAVIYVGNTLIGLGPVGGVQFNHSICRAIFHEGDTIFGDAIIKARSTLYTEVAYFDVGELHVEFPMDMGLFPDVEWYTQRSVIVFGDPALRVWTEVPEELKIDGPDAFTEGYNHFEVTVNKIQAPVPGVLVTLDQAGGVLVRKITDAVGKVEFRANLEPDDTVYITAWAQNSIPAVLELTYSE